MSRKTIDIDATVYERLAAEKREGESFSGVIDRLLAEGGEAHTGAEILEGVKRMDPLSEEDAQIFLDVVEENRSSEEWASVDLR